LFLTELISLLNLGSKHGLIRAIFVAGKVALREGFLRVFFLISTITHILPLPLNNLSLPSEMCDIHNLAERYHIIRFLFISFTGNSLLQGTVVTQEFIQCLI
jgi:hypothetical protein